MKIKTFYAKYKWQIWIFLAVSLSHFIFNPMVKSITSIPTELAAFSVAARMGGRDWSSLMSVTDYYGTGFYILFFPLFMLIKNPYLLHQAILLLVVFVSAIPSILCYNLMTKYFNISSEWYAAIVSFALSFVAVVRTNMAINEHPLRVLMWFVVYLVVVNLYTEERKKKILNSIIIALLLAYSMTLHTRALTLIIAFVLTIVLVRLVLGLKCVHAWSFMISFAILAVLSNLYVSGVTQWIWGSGELKNSTATITNSVNYIDLLFSRVGLKGYLNIILGQTFAANVYSCGLFMIAVVVFIGLTFNQLRVFFANCKRRKEKQEIQTGSLMENTMYIILFMMAACIAATILMHGLLSLHGVVGAVQTNTGAKAYFYLRYFYLYFQPIFVLIMIWLYHKREWVAQHVKWANGLWLIIALYVSRMIVPTAEANPSSRLDRFHYLSPFVFRAPDEFITAVDFSILICLILGLSIFFLFLLRKNKVFQMSIIVMLFFVYEYAYSAFGITMADHEDYYGKVNGFVEQVYPNEEIMETIDELYYEGSTFPPYVAQYEMPDLNVRIGYPDDGWGGAVTLTTGVWKNKLNAYQIYYVQLDENERAYFLDNAIYEAFTEQGYEVFVQSLYE